MKIFVVGDLQSTYTKITKFVFSRALSMNWRIIFQIVAIAAEDVDAKYLRHERLTCSAALHLRIVSEIL